MLLVPLLYGALYLWAFWSPTSHLDRLPVALVNSDTGATRDDGTRLTAGADLTDQLADGERARLARDRRRGRRPRACGTATTTSRSRSPSDFSTSLVSAGGDTPTSARIDVTYNDANSFIGTTLGRSAMTQVRDAVAATAGQQAVDQVLVGLGGARDGLVQASDGAVSLRDAATRLGDGAPRWPPARRRRATGRRRWRTARPRSGRGSAQVADGSATLADGAGRLAAGAQTASTSSAALADGAQQVADGVHAAVGQVDSLGTRSAPT